MLVPLKLKGGLIMKRMKQAIIKAWRAFYAWAVVETEYTVWEFEPHEREAFGRFFTWAN
jgi:hypothetical protein